MTTDVSFRWTGSHLTSEMTMKVMLELARVAFFLALAYRGSKLADQVQEQRFRDSIDILHLRGIQAS